MTFKENADPPGAGTSTLALIGADQRRLGQDMTFHRGFQFCLGRPIEVSQYSV
jgi:hypothetical protein